MPLQRRRPASPPIGRLALGLTLFLTWTATQADLAPQAGFSDIEPIDFSLQREGPTLRYRSSQARIFYSFQPAEVPGGDPASMPLFVFFNGGPGCPTCEGLLSSNTAPRAMFPYPWGPTGWTENTAANPHSWARLGNLLYVDPATTGYSYNLDPGVQRGSQTSALYDAQNFNPYIDAAQMVRVVLRFLRAHPALGHNPVVLVGESYGGTRVTTMQNLMLNYRRYGAGTDVYRDTALMREIQAYLDAYYNKAPGTIHSPAAIARQFGRQILIEPQLTGAYQSQITGDLFEAPGSIIHQLAAASGKTFVPCGDGCQPMEHAIRFVSSALYRSPYDTRLTVVNEGLLMFWFGLRTVLVPTMSELMAYDLTQVPGLYADSRDHAYHLKIPADPLQSTLGLANIPPGQRAWFEVLPQVIAAGEAAAADLGDPGLSGPTFAEAFGGLHEPDQHYVSCPPMGAYNAFYSNSAITQGYLIDPESPRYGRLFLENLPLVRTLITDARHDLMIYPDALPPSLARYTDLVKTSTVQRPCPDCDATIAVEYQPSAAARLRLAFPRTQAIWFPRYQDAGHSVAAGMPKKLVDDVEAWMAGSKP